MEESYILFDRDKFRDVVLHICNRCEPRDLGNVKLHKILYLADMMHFVSTGRPLTGVDYIKQRFGPTARSLSATLDALARDGAIRIETVDYFGFARKQFVPLQQSNARLTNAELELLDDVIEFVHGRSAKAISDLSHNAAWNAAEMGERIPYASAYGLMPVEITDADMAEAIEDARRIQPLIEAEARAKVGHVF